MIVNGLSAEVVDLALDHYELVDDVGGALKLSDAPIPKSEDVDSFLRFGHFSKPLVFYRDIFGFVIGVCSVINFEVFHVFIVIVQLVESLLLVFILSKKVHFRQEVILGLL